jgi:biopolymer transport protein TolR
MAGGPLADQGYFARRGGKFRRKPMAEINVTPMVDVMLVLLIVFMVTAPLLSVGVPVDLPKTKAATLNDSQEPLVISINSQGHVFLQKKEVSIEQLIPLLQSVTGAKPDTRIFVRGDQSIQYGTVMQVMGHISAAGFKKVSLMAELPKDSKKK